MDAMRLGWRFASDSRRHLVVAVLGALAAIAGTGAAEASCGGVTLGSFSPNPVNWQGGSAGYDPLDSSNYSQSVTFTLSKNFGSCTVLIGATTGGGDTGSNRTLANGSTTLSFNIYTDSLLRNYFKNPPDATSNQVISYTFNLNPSHQTTTLTFYYNVPPQQLTGTGVLVPTGTASRTVTFSGYVGSLNNPGSAVTSTNVNFQANVLSDMQISIVPSGQSFNPSATSQTLTLQTIDLQTAASGALDLWVRANTGFKLQLASQNHGVMKYSANPSDPSTVPYTLSIKINGSYTPISLGSTVTLSASTSATALGGLDYPLSIAISSLSNTASFPANQNLPISGNYGDVITITGIAQ